MGLEEGARPSLLGRDRGGWSVRKSRTSSDGKHGVGIEFRLQLNRAIVLWRRSACEVARGHDLLKLFGP